MTLICITGQYRCAANVPTLAEVQPPFSCDHRLARRPLVLIAAWASNATNGTEHTIRKPQTGISTVATVVVNQERISSRAITNGKY